MGLIDWQKYTPTPPPDQGPAMLSSALDAIMQRRDAIAKYRYMEEQENARQKADLEQRQAKADQDFRQHAEQEAREREQFQATYDQKERDQQFQATKEAAPYYQQGEFTIGDMMNPWRQQGGAGRAPASPGGMMANPLDALMNQAAPLPDQPPATAEEAMAARERPQPQAQPQPPQAQPQPQGPPPQLPPGLVPPEDAAPPPQLAMAAGNPMDATLDARIAADRKQRGVRTQEAMAPGGGGFPPDVAKMGEAAAVEAARMGMPMDKVAALKLDTMNKEMQRRTSTINSRIGAAGGGRRGGPNADVQRIAMEETIQQRRHNQFKTMVLDQFQLKGRLTEKNVVDELNLLAKGAVDFSSMASILRGRFARAGQGPGVLTDKDLNIFYNNMGGIAQKWGQSLSDFLSGTLTKAKQADIMHAVAALEGRAARREIELGEKIETFQAGQRYATPDETQTYLQMYAPGYLKHKQRQQDREAAKTETPAQKLQRLRQRSAEKRSAQ